MLKLGFDAHQATAFNIMYFIYMNNTFSAKAQ